MRASESTNRMESNKNITCCLLPILNYYRPILTLTGDAFRFKQEPFLSQLFTFRYWIKLLQGCLGLENDSSSRTFQVPSLSIFSRVAEHGEHLGGRMNQPGCTEIWKHRQKMHRPWLLQNWWLFEHSHTSLQWKEQKKWTHDFIFQYSVIFSQWFLLI